MIKQILIFLTKIKLSSKIKFDKFLTDIPNSYFLDYYKVKRYEINLSILILSFFISSFVAFITFFFDVFLGFLLFIIIFLAMILFFIRKIRKEYISIISEVEQSADLICNEILLIISTTHSIPLVIDYLSKGSYPIISPILKKMVSELNIGKSPIKLLEDFAYKQPSETIKEFLIEIVIPYSKGNLEIKNTINFETQWRIRKSFDIYLSQIEGKTSIFLAITTIIPITLSMLLVMLGHVSMNLVIFLPFVFFIFDLIAVEIFNSGKIKLLGG
ncbi:MAG: hypothetical protein FK731_13525 [Asgard group archaeon]|nr:hypothetical protein [Asgard group archaeon]